MTLINKIRIYKKETPSLREAIDRAVLECIEEDVLAEFLRKHRGEVMLKCLTEFNEEVYRKGLLEEGREEGREEGMHILVESLHELNLSDDIICSKLMEKYELSVEDAKAWLAKI